MKKSASTAVAVRMLTALLGLLALAHEVRAQADTTTASYSSQACPACAEWNAPREPFRVHGNTYYVGTDGLSAVLVTSDDGHILIDGGLPESAPRIVASIESLGFRVADVKLILNSHAHFDHAGGIAALQRMSGATVAASPPSARVLERGSSEPSDPQFGLVPPFPPVSNVRVIADGETLRVGTLALTAHFTPGHTPGGTSWSWQSCGDEGCVDIVYADSQTPVSAGGFYFTRNTTYPSAIQDFEHGFAVLEGLACDILLTPHPSASQLWERVEPGGPDADARLIDRDACKRYATAAREQLARRVQAEKESPPR